MITLVQKSCNTNAKSPSKIHLMILIQAYTLIQRAGECQPEDLTNTELSRPDLLATVRSDRKQA